MKTANSPIEYSVPEGVKPVIFHNGLDLCATETSVWLCGVEYKSEMAFQIVLDVCRTSWKIKKASEYVKKHAEVAA